MPGPWDDFQQLGKQQAVQGAKPRAVASKPPITRNQLIDKVAKAYVKDNAGSGFDAMRAGANNAFFGQIGRASCRESV